MKKIFITGILALCLVLGYVSLVMAEETNKVYNSKNVEVGYYEEFTSAQVSELRNADNEEGNHIAPTTTKSGYVFAGWYGKSDCQSDSALTNDAINTMLASEDSENATFYAKFVSGDILNVKAQLQGGTDSLSETSILRFVTTVDDLDYVEVGFTLVLNGKTYTSNTETVYKRLYAVGTTEEKSTLLPTKFHAGSRYFMAVNLTGIPADVFSKEATAIPYWVTCDGTKVENTDVETKSVVQGMPTVCEALVTNSGGDERKYYSTLEKAFTVSDSSNEYLDAGDTVTVIQDNVEIANQLYVYESITLTNEEERDVVVKRADTLTEGSFIYYVADITVKGTVSQEGEKGSLTFDGGNKTNAQAGFRSDTNASNSELKMQNISIKNIVATQTGGVIRSYGKATITGCTFDNNTLNINGTSATNGGVIYHRGNGELSVDNCTFTSNKANAGDGGAIYVYQGTANISGSKFESNSSAGTNGGGAVYARIGDTTISDTSFISNSAPNGGALYTWRVTTEISGSTFTSNTSTEANGGAIYYGKDTTYTKTLTLTSCTFDSNNTAAAGFGGAIYVNYGTVGITGGTFTSNGTTGAEMGGAIYVNEGTTTISGSGFNSNQATSRGGAVYDNLGTVTIQETCTFSENSASNGGALYVYQGMTGVSNSTFTSNATTEANGGAIYFGEDTENVKELTLTDCAFTSNDTASAGFGGAVYVHSGTAGITGGTFTSNGTTGADMGGAIYVHGGTTTISGVGFSSNKATSKGGAVYENLGTVTIQETCRFEGNNAANGGALYVNGGTAGVGGSTFTSNGTTGAEYGGAIYVNEGTTTISGTGFNLNQATSNGGAVYDNAGTVTIKEECIFEGNSAVNGGALHEEGGVTNISDSSFTLNVSSGTATAAGGGAIYYRGKANAILKLTRCTFGSNHAANRAGAVYIYRGGAEITGSTFASNGWNAVTEEVTTANGGAIYVRTGAVDISGTKFESNKANTSGGAVYVYNHQNPILTVSASTFSSNGLETTPYGGAIYISAGTTTVSDTDFNTNKVATDGGAIYNLKGALIVNNGCTFTSNTANNSNGGAIYVSDSTATLDVSDSTFTSNRAYIATDVATSGGGAIYVDAAQGEILNSVFDQNIGRRGGAIHVNTGTLTMQNDCTFSGNTSRRGGAIFVSSDGAASVTDCIFIGNGTTGTEITTYRGGAIHCAKEMTIDGCVFERNVATAASAAFSSSATFAVTNATLINQAETDFNESTSTTKLTLVTQANESATTNNVDNIHDADDGHQLSLLTNVDEAEFEAYCDRIESMGFELKSENTMGEESKTIARTYYSTERGYMLHTYWVEYSQEVRTQVAAMDESMLSPLRKLSGTEEEFKTVSDTSCTPLFHQLEALNYDDTAGIQSLEGGMGYIIRLKDGRFIIIDGGHRTETDPEDTSQTTNVNSDTLEILAFLAKNTPDPKNIVIASWIFTHTHSDHSGAFVNFTKYLNLHIAKVNYDFGTSIEKVKLESVMLNACDTEEQIQYCEQTKGGTEEILTDIIPNYWEAQWGSNPVVYKPLTGQVYTFADTSIEILHTMSDFLPNTIQYEEDGKGGDYNIQSVVSIVDVDNTADKSDRFFIMGDTTAVACNEMSRRYGTYMESDYVQVAHHGYNEFNTGHLNCRRHGATKEIYEYILKDDKSTIVMWPTSDKRFSDKTQTTIPINYWLVTEAPVKEHWIAESVSDENRTIEFE